MQVAEMFRPVLGDEAPVAIRAYDGSASAPAGVDPVATLRALAYNAPGPWPGILRDHHTVLTRQLHAHLRWRNANARHPDILTAQRRERARIRSEKGIRWGGQPITQAA